MKFQKARGIAIYSARRFQETCLLVKNDTTGEWWVYGENTPIIYAYGMERAVKYKVLKTGEVLPV